MRFMMIVKATKESEAGVMPTEQDLAEMGQYNEELARAGVMLSGEGLQPTSKGFRVRHDGEKRSVVDGPFTEAKELIAGFWMIEVRSRDEAVEWAKRIPAAAGEVEVRQVFEADDFGEEFTPELREQEDRIRQQIAKKQ
jgi:hypothetical protein